MVIKYLGIFPELFTNQFLKIAVMLLIKWGKSQNNDWMFLRFSWQPALFLKLQ